MCTFLWNFESENSYSPICIPFHLFHPWLVYYIVLHRRTNILCSWNICTWCRHSSCYFCSVKSNDDVLSSSWMASWFARCSKYASESNERHRSFRTVTVGIHRWQTTSLTRQMRFLLSFDWTFTDVSYFHANTQSHDARNALSPLRRIHNKCEHLNWAIKNKCKKTRLWRKPQQGRSQKFRTSSCSAVDGEPCEWF